MNDATTEPGPDEREPARAVEEREAAGPVEEREAGPVEDHEPAAPAPLGVARELTGHAAVSTPSWYGANSRARASTPAS
jgi:hypothetical protein